MSTLVVHTGGIGDFLLACPSIHALSKEGPVELLGRTERLQLAVAAGLARRAHSLDSVNFDSLFSEPSERVRNFLASFRRVVVWMRDDDGALQRALEQCGIGEIQIHPGLPPGDWKDHASDYYLSRLELDDAAFSGLSISPSEDAHDIGIHPDIVIHPGSGSPRKNWPFANFEELASRLEGMGRSVTWCLGPAEQEGAATAPWKRIPAQDILQTSSLVHLAGILANTSLYIGNDGGITHLAAAVGCPTLALFGPTNPRVWAPRGERVRVLQGRPWPDVDAAFDAATSLPTGLGI